MLTPEEKAILENLDAVRKGYFQLGARGGADTGRVSNAIDTIRDNILARSALREEGKNPVQLLQHLVGQMFEEEKDRTVGRCLPAEDDGPDYNDVSELKESPIRRKNKLV